MLKFAILLLLTPQVFSVSSVQSTLINMAILSPMLIVVAIAGIILGVRYIYQHCCEPAPADLTGNLPPSNHPQNYNQPENNYNNKYNNSPYQQQPEIKYRW